MTKTPSSFTNNTHTNSHPITLAELQKTMDQFRAQDLARRDQVHEMLKSYGGFLDPDTHLEIWVLPDAIVDQLYEMCEATDTRPSLLWVRFERLSAYRLRRVGL